MLSTCYLNFNVVFFFKKHLWESARNISFLIEYVFKGFKKRVKKRKKGGKKETNKQTKRRKKRKKE
jgi:hypothetical protein